jgi:hypothetical protein
VLLGLLQSRKSAKISSFARPRVNFARIEPVLAGLQLSDHGSPFLKLDRTRFCSITSMRLFCGDRGLVSLVPKLGHRDLGEPLVGLFFLVERLLKQIDRIGMTENLGQRSRRSVSGDFVMLHSLRGTRIFTFGPRSTLLIDTKLRRQRKSALVPWNIESQIVRRAKIRFLLPTGCLAASIAKTEWLYQHH